jgi:hypothetical protein
VDAVGIETDVDSLIRLEILFGGQDKDVATLCADNTCSQSKEGSFQVDRESHSGRNR